MAEPQKCVEEMIALMTRLGADDHLIRHGRLVATAAAEISKALALYGIRHNQILVQQGAAIHDIGKVLHPAELHHPGERHERAGEQLLLEHGLPQSLARMCVYHAKWDAPDATFEELVVAVADHLWRGCRHTELEGRISAAVASELGISTWKAFLLVESTFDRVAAAGFRSPV